MATPVQIVASSKEQGARVKVTGGKSVDISLVQNARVGDWLLVHGNLAINKISKKEADNIFQLIGQCSHSHSHKYKNSHSHSH